MANVFGAAFLNIRRLLTFLLRAENMGRVKVIIR